MKPLTKENLQAYAIEFSKIFGIDFEEKLKQETSKPTPAEEFFFSQDVFSVYKYAMEDKLIEGLSTFHDLIKDQVKHIHVSPTREYLKELSKELLRLAEMLDFCEYHVNITMDKYVATYKDYWLFQGHDIKKELNDLWLFPRIEKALRKKLFETYIYHIDNANTPAKDTGFKLNPNLYIVDSINSFLRFAKKENIDDVRATYLLKIEDILLYSYFVLVIQYKGNVWIGTDNMMFANPNNKYHRRNPARSREDHFDYLDLPYGILDDLETIRQKTKVPVPNSGLELHIYKMTDFPIGTKAFMHQLASNLITNLTGNQFKTIASYEDVILALPPTQDVRTDPGFSSNEYEGVSERTKEIQEFFKNTNSTALAVFNKDVVLKSKYYDPEWLATPESLQNLNNWIANEKVTAEYQEKFEKLYPHEGFSLDSNKRNAIELLHKEFANLLQRHLDNIFPYALLAEQVFVKFINKDIAQFARASDNVVLLNTACDYPSITIRNQDGHYTYHGPKGTCIICNNHQESRDVNVTFHCARELQMLFGLFWNAVPDWFKLYRYNGLIPYHGNSILDNVDPLAMLEDNVSRRYVNGFSIRIQVCAYCYNKLIKKYRKYKKALITFDLKENKIISVKELPDDDHPTFSIII